MTIYLVKNYLEGQQNEYFVETQEIADTNINPYIKCVVGTKTDAEARQKQLADIYIEAEKHRFVVTKEIQSGEDVTWAAVQDLATDDHNGAYQIFNTVTGQYEKAADRSEAVMLLDKVKNDFLVFSGLVDVVEMENLPSALAAAHSESTFGVLLGGIPVEVM